jgi:hypothetical protein
MPQGLAKPLASDPYQHHRGPPLATHADDADEAEGSPVARPLRHSQLAKKSIVYRHVDGATLGVTPWSTQITHLIVWNYRTVLHSLIVLHSLPLHYRPEQSLNPLSQKPLTKQASKACYIAVKTLPYFLFRITCS